MRTIPVCTAAWLLTCCVGALHADAPPALPDQAAVTAYAEGLLDERFKADGPGAAVLVARGDKVLFAGARGRASIELAVPLSADSRFRIGSVTKQFAAAGLLKLVDAGKVQLDDPLSKFLPDYPNAARITVRQLLNHTAGVPNYTDIAGYFEEKIRADHDTAGMIDVFKDLKVDFEPGAQWKYSNSGYVLVGAVIEKASGKPWHQWLDESVLQPAGLKDTAYGESSRIFSGMSEGYSPAQNGLVYQRAAPLSMTQPHAAGALISTVADLHRWNRALHGGKLLSKASYAAMTTPEGAAKDSNYGFGIVVDSLRGEPMLQHGGGINGFVTQLDYLPQSEISVVVLRNSDGALPITPDDLARRLAAFALGKPYPVVKPVKLSAAQLAEVTGVYRIDKDSTRVLRIDGDTLTAQRSGGSVSTVIPVGDDRFMYQGSLAAFRLERDAQGKVKGMRFWQGGEGEGAGEFVPLTDEKTAERKAIELPKKALERLVGEYEGAQLKFTVAWTADQAGITVQVPGQPAFVLHATSASAFFLKEVDATVTFAPETGAVSTATLKQGPALLELKRKP